MNKKFLNSFALIISVVIISFHTVLAQEDCEHGLFQESQPVLSRLHTLSIHVRDTITHDSVFKFLVDKLKLPVYYYPVKYGSRKYVGVYAGNLVLEPCGPYTDYNYGSDNFRAVFFGLTFEPFVSISASAGDLASRKIGHHAGEGYIYLQKDSSLCADNITISFMDRGQIKTIDKLIMASLRSAMNANTKTSYKVFERTDDKVPDKSVSVDYYNELGIQYVKQICIGYNNENNLEKWRQFISPSELAANGIWKGNSLPEFHFVNSEIKEVQSITFKVKSLETTRQYLIKNNLLGSLADNKIRLDKAKSFGLNIFFTEED